MKSEIRYVLDTDTCIYLLNGNRQIKERVSQVGIERIGYDCYQRRIVFRRVSFQPGRGE